MVEEEEVVVDEVMMDCFIKCNKVTCSVRVSFNEKVIGVTAYGVNVQVFIVKGCYSQFIFF